MCFAAVLLWGHLKYIVFYSILACWSLQYNLCCSTQVCWSLKLNICYSISIFWSLKNNVCHSFPASQNRVFYSTKNFTTICPQPTHLNCNCIAVFLQSTHSFLPQFYRPWESSHNAQNTCTNHRHRIVASIVFSCPHIPTTHTRLFPKSDPNGTHLVAVCVYLGKPHDNQQPKSSSNFQGSTH